MNFKHLPRASILAGVLCLAGVSPLATLSATNTAVAAHDSAEVSRLLKEARAAAGKLATTTDHFHSYVRNRLDWRTHAEKAHQVKNEVNTLGAHLEDLEALHHQAAPWQQSVIRSMRPIMVQSIMEPFTKAGHAIISSACFLHTVNVVQRHAPSPFPSRSVLSPSRNRQMMMRVARWEQRLPLRHRRPAARLRSVRSYVS